MKHPIGLLSLGVALVTPSVVTILEKPAIAGYYRYPLKGFHLACSDGNTTDAAMFPGVGLMLLRGNGDFTNSYPLVALDWSPVIGGGSSLCWRKPMSVQTQRDLIENFYIYCVQRRSAYCRYE